MANERKTVIQGISEVGAIRATVDVPFGRTAPNGVTIAFSGTDHEVDSGQSNWLEDIFRTADRVDITVRLIYADLLNMKEVLGLPDSALTGDLTGATPSPEILAIAENALGQREDALYVESPGPAGDRRYDFARTKLRAGLSIDVQKDGHVILEATWAALRPSSGAAVTITDAI
ncbi:MAG TPA: hypothetical protein VD838_21110 [Anaeromyxobacteraceae bacterium]|nr:hypothetical protein [Anaeromyxobacteraceae bacterium]